VVCQKPFGATMDTKTSREQRSMDLKARRNRHSFEDRSDLKFSSPQQQQRQQQIDKVESPDQTSQVRLFGSRPTIVYSHVSHRLTSIRLLKEPLGLIPHKHSHRDLLSLVFYLKLNSLLLLLLSLAMRIFLKDIIQNLL
jgi:hypothetical protein